MIGTEILNAWGPAWASIMIRAVVDSSVLLAIVLVTWFPLRRRMSAQFAHGLFLLVLLKLAAPIPTSWPSWSADTPLRWAGFGISARTTADGPRPETSPGVSGESDFAQASELIVAAVAPAPPPTARVVPETPGLPTDPPGADATLSVPAILMMAWAIVSAILLARFARSVRSTRRLIRDSIPVGEGSGWFPVDLGALRRTAGVRTSVRWAIHPGVTSPAVGGLLWPTVVMPPDLDDGLSRGQLNWVLLHELAHIRRGDLWVVAVQRLLGALFFFHPAVHIAGWIIDQLREYACDDAALAAAQASRRDCGEGFLTIVGRTVDHSPTPGPALGLFESRKLIHRRLLRILDVRRTVRARLSPAATCVLIALALVVVPYGHPRDASAGLSTATHHAATRLLEDEPRLFVPGPTIFHDDRAGSAGKPRAPVLAVAIAPDGETLATAGEDHAIVLRDPATGAVRIRLEGHADTVTSLAFSPDGETLASAGHDSTVRLWDPATGRLRATLGGHTRAIFALAFRPDGTTVASAGADRTIRLWDVALALETSRLEVAASAIRALAFSPDGATLAWGGSDRIATLRDLRDPGRTLTLRGHRGTIRALAFSPDGEQVASAAEDGQVKLWDPRNGREWAILSGHQEMVLCLAFTPSGASLVTGGADSTIKLWDPRAGRERSTLGGHADGVSALAIAPGARRMVSGGYDGTIRLWEAAAPILTAASHLDYPGVARAVAFGIGGGALHVTGSTGALATFDPRAGLPSGPTLRGGGSSLAVSPDGATIAIGGLDGKVRLVDATTRSEVAVLEGHAGEVRSVAFGRGGAVVGSGGVDGKVLLWQVASRARDRGREIGGPSGPICDLEFSPDGETLAVASAGRSGEVALFDAGSGRPLGTLEGRGSDVEAVAFSPDGRAIATVESGGSIALFDAATRAERASWRYPGGLAVAFDNGGRLLATGHRDGSVVLWDAASGRRLASLGGQAGPVSGVAFAPDGRTVAASGGTGGVRLWNLGARRMMPRASLGGELACVGPVAISPDGKTLAVAEVGYDSVGHIALWDLARRSFVTLHGHERGVASLSFSPDGRTLASSSWDLTTRLWDATSGKPRGIIATTGAVARVAFSPDGTTLASAVEDGALTLRDLESGSERARVGGFRGMVCTLAFSPDGRRIATGGGLDREEGGFGEVKVFDADSLRERIRLDGHTRSVRSLAFSPDGSTLLTGGVDSTVRLWEVESGKPRLALGGFPDEVRAVGISPDGGSLAVSARPDGVVSLLDLATGVELARLVGLGGPALGLSFSPDGRSLAAGGLDPAIRLWDVPAARPVLARR